MTSVPVARGTISALLGLALVVGPLKAQQEREFSERRVLRAVLAALRETGDVGQHPVVEARALCRQTDQSCTGLGRLLSPRTIGDSDSLAAEIGGRVGRSEDVHQCGATPRQCRLVSASALIVLGTPDVHGDSATVDVATWRPTSSLREPVSLTVFRAVVRRGNGNQLVASLRIVAES